MISNIINKLGDRDYRRAFLRSQINVSVPFQIRALREGRGWTQAKLAKEAEMLQPRVSAMEKPGGSKPNLETLLRIADAFDVGLIVRFAPFSEIAHWSEDFSPDFFAVPSFSEDADLSEDREATELSASINAAVSGLESMGPTAFSRGLATGVGGFVNQTIITNQGPSAVTGAPGGGIVTLSGSIQTRDLTSREWFDGSGIKSLQNPRILFDAGTVPHHVRRETIFPKYVSIRPGVENFRDLKGSEAA